jgi:tetratricopeptide (TPR) repeat protein
MRIGAGGLAALALLAAGAVGAVSGCAEPSVVRVINGHQVTGRFISGAAYALYARAVQEEASGGDLSRALAALKEAAEEDPASVEIWTRMGALYCRAHPGNVAHGEEALERAEAIDPGYAPLFRERARCSLSAADQASTPGARRQRLDAGLRAAEQAIALDPEDLPAQSLTAELLSRVGRDGDARRLLLAFAIRRPSSLAAVRALSDFGHAHRDEALLRRARRRSRELGAEPPRGAAARSPLAEIDEALARDDLPAAQRLAHRAHLPLSELAVRAAALGRIATARSQAEILVGADPSDTSARIGLAVAADMAGDPAALTAALAELPRGDAIPPILIPPILTPPSPLARLLFAELLARRVGPDAARDFLGPFNNARAGDELLARIERRVLPRLSQAAPPRAPVAP